MAALGARRAAELGTAHVSVVLASANTTETFGGRWMPGT
jgi:hypothetical protein